ncbi:hypothetical protein RND71_003306 [Anisodus tanguticus]|uniref:RNA helicase n=1 Tax=Anisodus tanguticus TaxID=243964 RepID=A0AAE1SVM9_9SOLA|nr:hypothetical protein RND71_003306 [Anisodus tanguticus]
MKMEEWEEEDEGVKGTETVLKPWSYQFALFWSRTLRVAQEQNVQIGEEVGCSIRFEDRTSEKTRIKYLTDGVLLRESLFNPELNQYSVIILDEAHERSLNMDILLGLMKRLIKWRHSNLKVLITSATLDGEKVSRFFSDCPVLTVPGELFPVEIVHLSERPKNYVEASLKKDIDIHVREPEGDILIFLTGQDDIDKLVLKLEEKVQSLEEGSCMDALILPLHGSLPPEMQASYFPSQTPCPEILNILDQVGSAFLLLLFSVDGQVRVFSPPSPNCRRFIVSTNIAETSLTVDGVVYVIDSEYVKQRQYNPSTGMYSLEVVQISKVQAKKRAGRAGRTRPGKCYLLYPSMVYHDDFLDATVPEIQRSSLAGTVLYLKSLDLADMDILKFDFLDSPSIESLEDALKQLYLIDAIDENGSITSIGRKMAELPLEPSLSRTLLEANELDCLSQALTVVSMLSAETTLLPAPGKRSEKKRKHTPPDLHDGFGLGDHIQLLQIYEQWYQTYYNIDWCKENNLQVHPSSVLKSDEDGMLPNYVVYHELIVTSRPFMRNVCAVDMKWAAPILAKLEKLNVFKLKPDKKIQEVTSTMEEKEISAIQSPEDRDSRIQAARERSVMCMDRLCHKIVCCSAGTV